MKSNLRRRKAFLEILAGVINLYLNLSSEAMKSANMPGSHMWARRVGWMLLQSL